MILLNTILPWLLTLCIVLLSLNYPLRRYCQNNRASAGDVFYVFYKFLRKSHRLLGILVIILTFLHCRFSSAVSGTNMGKICFLILLLMFIIHLFRNRMKKKWIIIHRALAVLLWIAIIVHIVQEIRL